MTMAPERPDRLDPPAVAGQKQLAPIRARRNARVWRRPDLSAPFAVTFMTGLMSGGLFLSEVLRHGVPLDRILPQALVDPFGATTLAFLAAAAVMMRIGDI
jgi:hypothetical protein